MWNCLSQCFTFRLGRCKYRGQLLSYATYLSLSTLRIVQKGRVILTDRKEISCNPTWSTFLLSFSGDLVNFHPFSCIGLTTALLPFRKETCYVAKCFRFTSNTLQEILIKPLFVFSNEYRSLKQAQVRSEGARERWSRRDHFSRGSGCVSNYIIRHLPFLNVDFL